MSVFLHIKILKCKQFYQHPFFKITVSFDLKGVVGRNSCNGSQDFDDISSRKNLTVLIRSNSSFINFILSKIKMKLFQTSLKYYAILGITSNYSTQTHPFNSRILISVAIYLIMISLVGVYLLFIANNFAEFIESLYMFTSAIVSLICYAIVILTVAKLFQLIESLQQFIENRE